MHGEPDAHSALSHLNLFHETDYVKIRGRRCLPRRPRHLENALMIYEVRTYTFRPGTVAEFEERFAKRLPLREKHSKLGALAHRVRSAQSGHPRLPVR